MTDEPRPPRLYDEEEVGRILKRATELQVDEPRSPAQQGGLSLAELEEIAREAGIDPRHLRRAAIEMDSGVHEVRGWDRLLGERSTLLLEAEVPGELPEEGFERIVAVIQQHADEHGQPGLLGRTLTWQAESANKTRTMQVVVTSRDGHTHVRVQERLGQFASGLFAGTVVGGGAGVGLGAGLPLGLEVFGSALFATAFPIGVVGLSYLLCRRIYRGVVGRRTAKLGALLEAVVDEARSAISERAMEAPDTLPELPR